MDPALNPYNPGSGLMPPLLAGRSLERERFDTLIARVGMGNLANRGLIFSGLRGVGKTVLLNQLRKQAEQHSWLTVQFEGRREEKGDAGNQVRLADEFERALLRSKNQRIKKASRRLLRGVESFKVQVLGSGIEVGFSSPDQSPVRLEISLMNLVEMLIEPLKGSGKGCALFIDEMQELEPQLLSSLLALQHAAHQEGWPFFIIGAGLPTLPATLSAARSYAERLFDYRVVGPLGAEAAEQALAEPAEKCGARYSGDAMTYLITEAEGYPFFLQVFGQQIWDIAQEKEFSLRDAEEAVYRGFEHLDQGFFPSRWDRATEKERRYMRAMVNAGQEVMDASDVISTLGGTYSDWSVARASLIKKGAIYAPERGKLAFTVPGMARFIERHEREEL